jgi:DNA-directed RNA polymerase subunit RPC12/RpoP
MMYCCHCGKEIDENKIESKCLSQSMHEEKVDENTTIEYVCPRCGHLIHHDVSEKEIKTLAAASHAEIQKGRNAFSNGMSLNCVGVIILILAIIFFQLSKKPAQNFTLVTTCPEFFVSMTAFAIGGVMLIVGLVFTLIGVLNKHKYQKLLDDIQDDVFHQ